MRIEREEGMDPVVLARGVGGRRAQRVPLLGAVAGLLQKFALHRFEQVLAFVLGCAAGQLEGEPLHAMAIFLDQHDLARRA